MLMSSVSGVDNRDSGLLGGNKSGALFGMTHSADVSIAGNHSYGVGNALALGSGAGVCRRKAQYASAKIEHRCFKAQTGSGTWLIKQGGQFFAVADMSILGQILLNVSCQRQKAVDFFHREIKRIQ